MAPRTLKKTPENICKFIIAFLDQRKAEDIVKLSLKGKSDIADYMIIASGTSQRHIRMMGELLKEYLQEMGIKPVIVEGAPYCDWILLDVQDIIVHLFRPEVRSLYNLEKMWGVDLADFSRKATEKFK